MLSSPVVQEDGCVLVEPGEKPLAPPGPSDQVARVALVQTVNSEVLDRLNSGRWESGHLFHPFSDFQCVRWTTSSGCFVGEFPRSDGRWWGDPRFLPGVPLLWDTWPPGPGLPHSTCSRGRLQSVVLLGVANQLVRWRTPWDS